MKQKLGSKVITLALLLTIIAATTLSALASSSYTMNLYEYGTDTKVAEIVLSDYLFALRTAGTSEQYTTDFGSTLSNIHYIDANSTLSVQKVEGYEGRVECRIEKYTIVGDMATYAARYEFGTEPVKEDVVPDTSSTGDTIGTMNVASGGSSMGNVIGDTYIGDGIMGVGFGHSEITTTAAQLAFIDYEFDDEDEPGTGYLTYDFDDTDAIYRIIFTVFPNYYNEDVAYDEGASWSAYSIRIADSDQTAEAATSHTATPTSSQIVVDGEVVNFDAYNINGNNYFKLRDVAYILNGSEKGFNVTWDGDKSAISLTSNCAYTAVGGELTLGDGTSKQATFNQSAIYLDGVQWIFTAYTIGDNNYVQLRDLGETFDFNVSWDGTNNTIVVDTTESYTSD